VLPLMIDRAKKGLQVVRLHDGDPCLYGALSEQICGLNDAGILSTWFQESALIRRPHQH
jgi:precorrin-4/cobalt-precorrin-4 C11-methyltransferase